MERKRALRDIHHLMMLERAPIIPLIGTILAVHHEAEESIKQAIAPPTSCKCAGLDVAVAGSGSYTVVALILVLVSVHVLVIPSIIVVEARPFLAVDVR